MDVHGFHGFVSCDEVDDFSNQYVRRVGLSWGYLVSSGLALYKSASMLCEIGYFSSCLGLHGKDIMVYRLGIPHKF